MMAQVRYYGPYLATFAAVLGMLLFLLAVVYTFRQQQHVDHQQCIGTVENRQAVRSTWNAARLFIIHGQTEAQQKRTNEFFDAVLKPIPQLVCIDNKPVPVE